MYLRVEGSEGRYLRTGGRYLGAGQVSGGRTGIWGQGAGN